MTASFPPLSTELILHVLEAAAVIASAMAGMFVAADKRMDLVGAFALACVNAFGGGTVRDLLLDNRPFYWMTHWAYFLTILAICIPFVYSVKAFRVATAVHRRSVRMDAVGLALFTITGVGIALTREAPVVVAVLMGVIAGTTGGVLRDVFVNEVPDLFRPGGLYATAAFAGAATFVGALELGVAYSAAALLGIALVILLRVVSVRLRIGMPDPQWLAEAKRDDPP
jgi:uncharacterized membrane protein YeiH